MPLGVHTSIAGGLALSVERAARLGCDAMQIFGRNPRSWIYKPVEAGEAAVFRAAREGAGICQVAVHTNYLINLSSPDDELFEKSKDIFKKELGIAEAIGADYLVTHLGSPRDASRGFAVDRVIAALLDARTSGLGEKTMVLIENTSGAGTGFGADLADLGAIIEGASMAGLTTGLCLDTCHAFAAGYAYSSPAELDAFIGRLDSEAGASNVRLVHLNDSKGALGSCLDRHEHIGRGSIGIEAFRLLLNHPWIKDLPMILETPKKTDIDDTMNLEVVRGLISG